MKIKDKWSKLTIIKKSGFIGVIIAIIFYIVLLLDVFYSISTKIPLFLQFIFIPAFPIIILGVYGCGWLSFNGGENFFGSLCDNTYSQIILFLVISTVIGYLFGALVGYAIKKFKKK